MKERLIEFWQNQKIIKDKRLVKAFREVNREDFVRPGDIREAYGDYPLPIGNGQTISQPTTIMMMIEALELKKTDKVLEVGTGSGYNAALISRMVKKVYTTEIIPELVEFAEDNLKKAGIENVEVIECDGSKGYKKAAPYDKVIITAACPAIPPPIIEQLKENGIVIAPVGDFLSQIMTKAKKIKGKLKEESLGYFLFVPLKGEYGF